MKPIFEYLEYRDYLRDYYEEKKSENFFFSFQYMGKKAGMDASAMAKIFSAQRHLPVKKIKAFQKLLQLEGIQAEYFETLVLFCREKTDKVSRELFEKLIQIRASKGYTLTSRQYKFYSKWHYTAIRAMLGIGQWKQQVSEFEEIARRLDPPLRANQVEQAVNFLIKSELIQVDEEGYLKPTNRHIRSGKAADKQSIRKFQLEMMDQAKRSLAEQAPEIRDISTLTVAMEKDSLQEIRQIIAECRDAIRERIELHTDPDSIYQLNVQLFPLTRSVKEEN